VKARAADAAAAAAAAMWRCTPSQRLTARRRQAAEALGFALAELGESEEAVGVLQRACELCPAAGYEKFMYLGQLLSGAEGVAALRSGVRLLEAEAAGGRRAPLPATQPPPPPRASAVPHC